MVTKQKLVLASNNQGKLFEMQSLLAPLEFEVLTQKDFSIADIPETGTTFVENAIIKARHVAEKTGLPAIADDSGLMVAGLNGAPGLYSARYAGEPSDSQANIVKLLKDLEGIEERKAQFICVLVYLRHAKDPMPLICQGLWSGEILLKPKGCGGFGYDPIFYVPTHNCSAAELNKLEKNNISHRAQALRQLLAKIKP